MTTIAILLRTEVICFSEIQNQRNNYQEKQLTKDIVAELAAAIHRLANCPSIKLADQWQRSIC
jgi:hypothetical protein